MTAAGREAFAGWCAVIARALVRDGFGKAEARRLATLAVAALEGALILARVEASARPIEDVAKCARRRAADQGAGAKARAHDRTPTEGDAMDDAQEHLDRAEIESFFAALGFVREYGIDIVSADAGRGRDRTAVRREVLGAAGAIPGVAGRHRGRCGGGIVLPVAVAEGWALATLDFTIKMTGVAKGEKLRARGRVLQAGRTNSVGAADVYTVSGEREVLCGTVLATTRNFQIKSVNGC